mmetsp:Transcript_18579/g.42729  ORF Transcript_18579/g.42729 Transcript_18579/m.42729 type:complete len:265 (-) Transcript_18579:755-1549(-)
MERKQSLSQCSCFGFGIPYVVHRALSYSRMNGSVSGSNRHRSHDATEPPRWHGSGPHRTVQYSTAQYSTARHGMARNSALCCRPAALPPSGETVFLLICSQFRCRLHRVFIRTVLYFAAHTRTVLEHHSFASSLTRSFTTCTGDRERWPYPAEWTPPPGPFGNRCRCRCRRRRRRQCWGPGGFAQCRSPPVLAMDIHCHCHCHCHCHRHCCLFCRTPPLPSRTRRRRHRGWTAPRPCRPSRNFQTTGQSSRERTRSAPWGFWHP